MIRFTVVDRLVRLAMAALSPRECVYMMYILGIRNGVHPGGAYIVGGNETETETDLRTRDTTIGVAEGVFELPDSERQVQAPSGGGNITALLNNAAVNTIGSFRIHEEDMSYEQWRNEGVVPATPPPFRPTLRYSYPSPSEHPVEQEEPDWLARAYDTGAASPAVAGQVETRVYAEITAPAVQHVGQEEPEDAWSTSVPSRAVRAALPARVTPGFAWTEEDEQLFRRIADARR